MFDITAQTKCFVDAALTGISGAATTYSTSATALSFCVNSIMATKAQASGAATPTTGAISAAAITLTASKARFVVWAINVSGTVSCHEGPVVDLDTEDDSFIDGRLPAYPAIDYKTYCVISTQLIKAASTTVGTWTFGTDNWNATGLSHNIIDHPGILPDRPKQS